MMEQRWLSCRYLLFSHQQMEAFLEGADAIWRRLGGFPSVRKHPNKKVEIWFGQDESTFSSHSMNEKCWKVDGECPFRNKGEGKGLMASAFNSFGIRLLNVADPAAVGAGECAEAW